MFRIMAVEDDPVMQKALKDLLGPAGYEVLICPDVRTCLERLPAEKPDLLLMDVNLPDGDGIEACGRIKADAALKHIPVLILTGEAKSLENREAGLRSGADDYILKPFSSKILLARIAAILKTSTRPTHY